MKIFGLFILSLISANLANASYRLCAEGNYDSNRIYDLLKYGSSAFPAETIMINTNVEILYVRHEENGSSSVEGEDLNFFNITESPLKWLDEDEGTVSWSHFEIHRIKRGRFDQSAGPHGGYVVTTLPIPEFVTAGTFTCINFQ